MQSLDDARLEKWRIGIHIVGDDYAPPAVALARRGLAANLAGYSLLGAYGEANPPAKLVEAVERGDVDIAIIWGPFAGYFAKREPYPLEISPVSPAMFLAVPFTYEMSLGVRKGDDALRDKLDAVIERRCAEIQALLEEYGVPLAPQKGEPKCEPTQPSRSAVSR